MRATSMLIVIAVAVFLANGAIARGQEQQDILKVLAEKAREREAQSHGMDWVHIGSTMSPATGKEILSYRSRFVESNGRTLWEDEQHSRPRDGGDNAAWNVWTIRRAFDGRVLKSMDREGNDQWRGSVNLCDNASIDEAFYQRGEFHDAVPGMLSEILDANSGEYAKKYSDWMAENSISVTVRGVETVNGQDCVSVDISVTRTNSGDKTLRTLAFDKALNYACVRYEWQGRSRQETRSEVWTMEDFREVKPGFHFAFAWREEVTTGGRSLIFKRTTEKLEFPETFDDSLFTFEFPAGTRVYDGIRQVEYIAGQGLPKEDVEETIAALGEPGDAAATDGAAEDAAKAVSPSTDVASTAQGSAAEPETGARVESVRGFLPVGLAVVVLVILAAALALGVALRRRGRNA